MYGIAALALVIGSTQATHRILQPVVPNGVRCGASQAALGDIPPKPYSSKNWVAAIEKVVYGRRTVGYVYSINDGSKLLQPTYEMPRELLVKLHASPLQLVDLPHRMPHELHVVACPNGEMTRRAHHLGDSKGQR